MSYLDKLLDGLAVEWKPLGDVVELKRGRTITANSKIDGNIPVISGGQKPAYYNADHNREGETITIAGSGAYAGYIMYWNKPIFVSDAFSVKPDLSILSTKYVLHSLLNNQAWIHNLQKGVGVPHVYPKDLGKLEIPIPCPENPKKSLEIQQKIVAILDSFTELTAELTARKMQYSYYREKLYYFDQKEVQHLPLGDESIGKFIRGGGLQKKDFTETGVGCIHYGQIYTYYGTYTDKTKTFVSQEFAKKARMAKYGDLVIATTSETDDDVCKAVVWLGDKEIAVSSDACFYRHNLNPKFVAYFFQTEQFQKQKRPFITGTKVRRVNADDLAKIKIPVLSKQEQERIVSILDKFDILTTSISEGLPKEIELRKKQYEYYRDLLLTFKQQNV